MDVVDEDVTLAVVNCGKEQYRAFAAGFFAAFPDVTLDLTSGFVAGSLGGAEWVMRGSCRCRGARAHHGAEQGDRDALDSVSPFKDGHVLAQKPLAYSTEGAQEVP